MRPALNLNMFETFCWDFLGLLRCLKTMISDESFYGSLIAFENFCWDLMGLIRCLRTMISDGSLRVLECI